jgi:hypothetical protein
MATNNYNNTTKTAVMVTNNNKKTVININNYNNYNNYNNTTEGKPIRCIDGCVATAKRSKPCTAVPRSGGVTTFTVTNNKKNYSYRHELLHHHNKNNSYCN